jgi:hypothetical protein
MLELWSHHRGMARSVRFFSESRRIPEALCFSAAIWMFPEGVSGLPVVADLVLGRVDR